MMYPDFLYFILIHEDGSMQINDDSLDDGMIENVVEGYLTIVGVAEDRAYELVSNEEGDALVPKNIPFV